ncbi:MAG: hypothetical protein M4579_007539 [Chaenotheca gracillima]|nr:MAG: hypothetical protein M4579_007539 [Chaenotheca gracillima]
MDRFARVTHYSTGISMLACLTMAIAGFLTFRDKTEGNVLNNFPTDNVMVNIARFCFGLNMLTTLPLEAFVCREVMTTFFFPDEPFNPNRHLIFSTSLVVSAVFLSLLTCDLGVVFELIGATSACALAYILPPLCYLKLLRDRDQAPVNGNGNGGAGTTAGPGVFGGKNRRSFWTTTLPAVACVVFGTVVMAISLILAGAKMIRNEGGAKICR